MISARNMNCIQKEIEERYDHDESRIVGIMLARYELPHIQRVIEYNYRYWNLNTGGAFDIFWAGYGEYLCPDDEDEERVILKYPGNKTHVYYDAKAFVDAKRQIEKCFKGEYHDNMQLILVNYHEGKLHFKESIRIDFNLDPEADNSELREVMELITQKCNEEHDVIEIAKKLRSIRTKKTFRKVLGTITVGSAVGNIIGIAGLAL